MAMKKTCRAQLTLTGSWGTVHLQPGWTIDLDRELRPASAAVPAKGDPGTDGYVAARPAVTRVTVADAVAGREDCFDDVPETTTTNTTSAATPKEQE
jgi:hypothetical protein